MSEIRPRWGRPRMASFRFARHTSSPSADGGVSVRFGLNRTPSGLATRPIGKAVSYGLRCPRSFSSWHSGGAAQVIARQCSRLPAPDLRSVASPFWYRDLTISPALRRCVMSIPPLPCFARQRILFQDRSTWHPSTGRLAAQRVPHLAGCTKSPSPRTCTQPGAQREAGAR